MPEMWAQDGKNRKRLGSAPEKVSALRRQSGIAHFGVGDSVQGLGLVRNRLRGQKTRFGSLERGQGRLRRKRRGKGFRRQGFRDEGFRIEREEDGKIREAGEIGKKEMSCAVSSSTASAFSGSCENPRPAPGFAAQALP